MMLLAPWALLGLLLLPVLFLFYLFRPEPRRTRSTTYFLWREAIPDSQGGRFAQRLQSNPLLWLQLLILLLLVLFLCRPGTPWKSASPSAGRVVIMLDRSASTNAAGAFERAREQAIEAVDQMMGFALTGSAPEVMLIAVDAEPRVLLPFTRDAARLRETLSRLRPTDIPDDLERMGPFVRSLVKAHKAKVWIFGDHLPEALRLPGVQFTSVAAEGNDNAGVLSFSVQGPDPERGQTRPFLYARLENFSDTAQQRLVRVEKLRPESPDRVEGVVLEKTVLLPSGSGQTVVESLAASRFDVARPTLFRFSLLPIPGDEADIFPVDDVAYTVSEPFGQQALLVATAESPPGFLLRAVAASGQVKLVSIDQLAQTSSPPAVDLLLAPVGFRVPSGIEVRSRFLLAPPPGEDTHPVTLLRLAEDDAPLVADSGIEWSRMKAQITDLSPLDEGETVLLTSEHGPALTLSGLEEGLPTLRWRFPPHYSSLPLSSGLPVLVGRFVDLYSRNSGSPLPGSITTAQAVNRPAGHRWRGRLELEPSTERARLLGSRWEIAEDQALLVPPPAAGVYTLRSGSAPQGAPVAVNLGSPQESRLPRDHSDLRFQDESDAASPVPSAAVQYQEVRTPLLLLVLLLLLVEAAVFLRRGRP